MIAAICRPGGTRESRARQSHHWYGADFLSRAETKLRQQGRLRLLSQVLNMQVLDNLELGDWDRAVSCAEEAKRLAHETGQLLFDAGSLSLHAMIVALRGDNEQARSMASEVERAAGSRRLNSLLCCVQLIRGFGLISQGQHTEAYEARRAQSTPPATANQTDPASAARAGS